MHEIIAPCGSGTHMQKNCTIKGTSQVADTSLTRTMATLCAPTLYQLHTSYKNMNKDKLSDIPTCVQCTRMYVQYTELGLWLCRGYLYRCSASSAPCFSNQQHWLPELHRPAHQHCHPLYLPRPHNMLELRLHPLLEARQEWG